MPGIDRMEPFKDRDRVGQDPVAGFDGGPVIHIDSGAPNPLLEDLRRAVEASHRLFDQLFELDEEAEEELRLAEDLHECLGAIITPEDDVTSMVRSKLTRGRPGEDAWEE